MKNIFLMLSMMAFCPSDTSIKVTNAINTLNSVDTLSIAPDINDALGNISLDRFAMLYGITINKLYDHTVPNQDTRYIPGISETLHTLYTIMLTNPHIYGTDYYTPFANPNSESTVFEQQMNSLFKIAEPILHTFLNMTHVYGSYTMLHTIASINPSEYSTQDAIFVTLHLTRMYLSMFFMWTKADDIKTHIKTIWALCSTTEHIANLARIVIGRDFTSDTIGRVFSNISNITRAFISENTAEITACQNNINYIENIMDMIRNALEPLIDLEELIRYLDTGPDHPELSPYVYTDGLGVTNQESNPLCIPTVRPEQLAPFFKFDTTEEVLTNAFNYTPEWLGIPTDTPASGMPVYREEPALGYPTYIPSEGAEEDTASAPTVFGRVFNTDNATSSSHNAMFTSPGDHTATDGDATVRSPSNASTDSW